MNIYGNFVNQTAGTGVALKQDTLTTVLQQAMGNMNDIQSEIALIGQALDGPTQEKVTEACPTPFGVSGMAMDIRSRSSRLADALRSIRIRLCE